MKSRKGIVRIRKLLLPITFWEVLAVPAIIARYSGFSEVKYIEGQNRGVAEN